MNHLRSPQLRPLLTRRLPMLPVPALLCLTGAVSIWVCLLVAGCKPIEENLPSPSDIRTVTVTKPLVERDLTALKARGVIRMITRYNSSSYFIHKGGHAGFEYELLSWFARRQGLIVEVVVPGPDEHPFNLLNSGRGDVVATGSPLDVGFTGFVTDTHPYIFTSSVLVLPSQDDRPDRIESLAGLRIHLPRHSPQREQLQLLREQTGLRFFVVTAGPLVESEELIARVARGAIPATVANWTVARAALSYLPGARIGVPLSDDMPVCWQIRQNSPELLAEMNRFLNQHFRVTSDGPRRNGPYGILFERYYGTDRFMSAAGGASDRPDLSGRISAWDHLILAAAKEVELDWRLVAALIYEESRFQSDAVSSAGATGLMQVLPRLAGDEAAALQDPEVNIRIGVNLLKRIHDSYAYLDSLEQLQFTLGTYHAGMGHMADARRLAMDVGKDPNRWAGSVKQMLPRLMEQRFYSQTRHGFYRGTVTVAYVQSILNRYHMYRRLVPLELEAEMVLRDWIEPQPAPE
ncbi:MAG: transglycosylase SLT domain-containing protein [bacterium]